MDADQIFNRANQLIKAYRSGQGKDRFLEYKDPKELETILNLDAHRDGADWPRIFDWIEQYLTYSVNTNHKGIENVDSLTWDFHKMLGTSLICNVFLINNRPRILGRTVSSENDTYLFHDDSHESMNSVRDLGAVSLQCGRRVDSLKWFLDWKYFGKKEFGRRISTLIFQS